MYCSTKNTIGALLTDFSKTCDCLSHDLLITKLNTYGFIFETLRLVPDYLPNCKQRIKVNSIFSSWEESLFGFHKCSICRFLLFSIFICDLFFIMNNTDFDSYVDDNTPYKKHNRKCYLRCYTKTPGNIRKPFSVILWQYVLANVILLVVLIKKLT